MLSLNAATDFAELLQLFGSRFLLSKYSALFLPPVIVLAVVWLVEVREVGGDLGGNELFPLGKLVSLN